MYSGNPGKKGSQDIPGCLMLLFQFIFFPPKYTPQGLL